MNLKLPDSLNVGGTSLSRCLRALKGATRAAGGGSDLAPNTAEEGSGCFSKTIREYLRREACRITQRASSTCSDLDAARQLSAQRRRQFLEMMGFDELLAYDRRTPLNVKVTGVLDQSGYRIEKLYYESLPRLYVTANLYVPNQLSGRAPGVVYLCGHAQMQKVHYQAHARRFAELGFVCLLIETLEGGEVRGCHHGPYREGCFHWYSRGYTPAGIEMFNGIRGLDLLAQRPEVNPDKLGTTGGSGGGAYSWWVPAADERVKATAPVCGTGTLRSHICDMTLDMHCDCMWWINTYRWDLADVGTLIAPRPLLIASANEDPLFQISSVREVYSQLRSLYEALGAADNLRLVETPGAHAYHPRSRTAVFSWFLKHLQGKEMSPEEVGDIDASAARREPEKNLRVFVHGLLKGNRTATIQNDFRPPPAFPEISDRGQLQSHRVRIVAAIREKTFGAFPVAPPALDLRVEVEAESGEGISGYCFAFTSEEGWRLHGHMTLAKSTIPPAQVVVALRGRGETNDRHRSPSEDLLKQVRLPWVKVAVEPRGTGGMVWDAKLSWHVRRAAAWTGRTLASMWVFDALRALEAIRTLPEVKTAPIALAARGEMAAVALYTALLDERVSTLFLDTPPATQNAPSRPDGRGPAIEMLNCLRFADLPQIAGLLFPAELVFVGKYPPTYKWAEDIYTKLGRPERFRRVRALMNWQPGDSE